MKIDNMQKNSKCRLYGDRWFGWLGFIPNTNNLYTIICFQVIRLVGWVLFLIQIIYTQLYAFK